MKTKTSEWLEWGARELVFLEQAEALRECEQALGFLLGVSRSELYLIAQPDPLAHERFSEWVQARKKRVPSAYLLKHTSFWEDEFQIEGGVFIPRPETEILIESFFKTSGFSRQESFYFLDLGTGSGIIALTLAKRFPHARGVAADLSEKALAVARANAERLGVGERIQWVHSDCLSAFKGGRFDCILSNPPYVASGEWRTLEPEVHWEPRLALDGGKDGLEFYRKIFQEIHCLKKKGTLWVEIGWGQSEAVQTLFERAGFHSLQVFKDLNEIDRVLSGIHLHG